MADFLKDDSNASTMLGLSFNPPAPAVDERLDDTDEFLEDLNDEQFAHKKMAALNHHSILKTRSEIDSSKGLIARTSMNSYIVSPRSNTGHDYTDIMGYKNMNISRDVD